MASYDDTAIVSGSIVRVNDGADSVPLKNWIVTLPASLDGYTEVNGVQTLKNLFNYEDVEAFNANVIITRNNGDYTMQNNNSYAVGAFRGIQFHLKPATYSMSLGEAITAPIRIYKNGSWFNNGINAGNTSCTFTVTEEADYDFSCNVAANSSLTIKKCQFEVGSAPTQYTAELGRTIYGGQADIVNGQGTETHKKAVFDGSSDENWTLAATGTYRYGFLSNNYIENNSMYTSILCDTITVKNTSENNDDGITCRGTSYASRRFYVFIPIDNDLGIIDVTTFKAWLANNPCTIIYPPTTGFEMIFQKVDIQTSKGSNTFWSEQGDSEVTYYKDGYGFTSVTIHKETPDGEPVEETRKLHHIIYEGQVDVISGTGLIYRGESGTQYDPPEQISFTPIEIATDEGENTLYADEGDSAITYRKEIT